MSERSDRAPVWYRWLLRLLPRAFHDRYGTEMSEYFAAAWAEARGWGRVRLSARAIRDVLESALLERRYLGRGRRRKGREEMGEWIRDVRLALRGLRRRPGFGALAIATIALGIGAASAVFAVVDAVVLRPLPYPIGDRLVAMWTTFEDQGDFGMSLAEQYDFAAESRALEALGSFGLSTATLTGTGAARQISQAQTWGALYEVIGARAALGRLPSQQDSRTGAAPVAVLSHNHWTSAFGADPEVVGRSIELNQVMVEVIGVMEEGVRLPTAVPELWRPIAIDRADLTDRSGHWLDGLGRLAPGATIETLYREIDAVHERWHVQWAGAHSPGHPGHGFAASMLHERYFGELSAAANLLLAAVGLIILLACANVASMLLARGEARVEEVALRRALGAGTGRIIRQSLVESLVLAVAGGVIGVSLASPGVRLLMSLEPGNLPRAETIGLDPRVLAFAVLLTLVAALLFGTLPALRAGAARIRRVRAVGGLDRSLSRSLTGLVIAQVGLAVVLLGGAGLLVRSVDAMARSDAGFESDGRIAFRVAVAQASYPALDDINDFWRRLTSDLERVAGVEEAAVVRLLPLRDGLRREGVWIEGRGRDDEDAASIAYGVASSSYFSAMGIPIVDGRSFAATDGPEAPLVAVVNEAAVRAYWPDGNAVGQRVYPRFWPDSAGSVTVVGVAGDVRSEGHRASVTPELYLHYPQTRFGRGYARSGAVVARVSGDPTAVLARVPEIVERVDPTVPVTELTSMDDVVVGARARERFLATLLGAFAMIALILSGMGTYGVVAFAVARRGHEFGVRLALGALRRNVLGSVLRSGGVLAVVGATIGLLATFATTPLLESMLFGIDPRDVLALAVGPLVMVPVVLVACAVPALRASRVDPAASLRGEL